MIASLLQIIFGLSLTLFIPGYALSWAFFPKKKEMELVERIVLSFGLSISVVPLAVFYMNKLFGQAISLVNNLVVILLITGLAVFAWKKRK